jgi:hypothetical protein
LTEIEKHQLNDNEQQLPSKRKQKDRKSSYKSDDEIYTPYKSRRESIKWQTDKVKKGKTTRIIENGQSFGSIPRYSPTK